MSEFSPKIYQIYQYDDTNLDEIPRYYDCFTLLEKPRPASGQKDRNVYKLSLAQMLHYMVDFGIGYNSKCVTTLTTQQQFTLCRYVNRHDTSSPKRPATVADLKKKIRDVVEAMVKRCTNYNGNLINNPTNTIYPKYFFTLDKELTTDKIKKLTGHTYREVTNFENFAYASNSTYDMPKYTTGYVPISAVRCVPNHSHDTHSKIKETISYSWEAFLDPQGAQTVWVRPDKAANISCNHHSGFERDSVLGQVLGANFGDGPDDYSHQVLARASVSPSWDKPSGVSCFENEEKDPSNTVNLDSGKMLSIRYHGRRYRLFIKDD